MVATTEWLVDQLIRSVRRRAYMPQNDATFSPADMLEVANEEMRDYMVPFLRDVHEEFLVASLDVTVAAGVASIRLPQRCAGEQLKGVLYDAGSTGVYTPMRRIDSTDVASASGVAFYLEDDEIVFTPAPTSALRLRLKYIYRPSRMVLVSDCVQTTTPGGYLSLTPGASTTVGPRFTDGALVDIVAGQPGFRTLVMDATAVTAVGASFIFSTVVPTTVAVGDYVCLAGESCFPQIPEAAWGLLAQRIAVKLLEGKGGSNYSMAKMELEGDPSTGARGLRATALSMLKQRTERNPQFIQNFDAPGWSSNGRMRSYP